MTAHATAASRALAPGELAGHRHALYRAARAMGRSHHDAEDAVQETFARALSRRRMLRRGGEWRYLRRILRNLLIDEHRRAAARPALAQAKDAAAIAEREAPADALAGLRAEALVAAIAALPEHLRTVLTAVDVQGCTYREAADHLGVPTGTVMSRLFRARARVADALAPEI